MISPKPGAFGARQESGNVGLDSQLAYDYGGVSASYPKSGTSSYRMSQATLSNSRCKSLAVVHFPVTLHTDVTIAQRSIRV